MTPRLGGPHLGRPAVSGTRDARFGACYADVYRAAVDWDGRDPIREG